MAIFYDMLVFFTLTEFSYIDFRGLSGKLGSALSNSSPLSIEKLPLNAGVLFIKRRGSISIRNSNGLLHVIIHSHYDR